MIIAHLPAGYTLWRATKRRLATLPLMVGAILPDFDLIAVYGFGIHVHHHEFFTHKPALWITLALAGALLRWRWMIAVGLGAVLHVTLDSLSGRIDWAWPFAHYPVTLIDIPARFDHWLLSFLLHPTFLIELTICAVAITLHLLKRKDPRP